MWVYERFIYFHDRSAYSSAGKYMDRSWEYLNRSQTHECGNWDWGRTIPRKWIHKWDFRCSAVQPAVGVKVRVPLIIDQDDPITFHPNLSDHVTTTPFPNPSRKGWPPQGQHLWFQGGPIVGNRRENWRRIIFKLRAFDFLCIIDYFPFSIIFLAV
jgi:hypothetical protein